MQTDEHITPKPQFEEEFNNSDYEFDILPLSHTNDKVERVLPQEECYYHYGYTQHIRDVIEEILKNC